MKLNEITLSPSQTAYLPGFWYHKLKFTANPGPLICSHLLCLHGKIKPDYFDCFPPKNTKSANSILIGETSTMEQSANNSLLEDTAND